MLRNEANCKEGFRRRIVPEFAQPQRSRHGALPDRNGPSQNDPSIPTLETYVKSF
jgi:hypothetical protein